MTFKFKSFVGASINGVYVVRAEDAAGNVKLTVEMARGHCLAQKIVTRDAFDALYESWSYGLLAPHLDARTAQRAMSYIGHEIN